MKIFKSLLSITLIFILASCNVTSSSLTSSTDSSTSQITSSVVQTGVNSIELTTNSSLTQFLGLTSRVVVNARLNVSAPSGAQLEWFVDNERSLTQNGLTFEFFPTAVRSYSIQARAGSVVSNTLTINVSLPRFNLVNVNARSSTQLEVRADTGVSFSVSGVSIASSSSYNIANQTYTLNLLSPMVQGNNYLITASKAGFESTTFNFLYETRRLSVSTLVYGGKRINVNAEGVYELQKPFTGSTNQNYTISLAQTNLEGTSVPITIITNVPAGATAIAPYQTTLTIQKGIDITQDYTLTSTSEPGLYVHNVNVNNVNLVVRILVVNPVPTVTLVTPIIYDVAATSGGGVALSNPFATDVEGEYIKEVVKPETNGQYIVYRPYNGSAFELTFTLAADNFPTPIGFPAAPANPYNLIAGLVGPSGGVMYYAQTVNTLTTSFPFRETTGNSYRVSQYIDNKTTLGTYTYTFTATGYNLNVNRTITIVVREYTPTIEPIVVYNGVELKPNSDGSFTIFKPLGDNALNASISAKISYYESPLASGFAGGTGVTTLYNGVPSLRYLLDTRITYSGPLSSVAPLVTKLGIELGSSDGERTVTSQTSPAVDYKAYTGAAALRTIDLLSLRDLDTYTVASNTNIFDNLKSINASSFPGVHTYTVQIGALSRSFVFRLVEPTPLIITRDNVVEYGPTSGAASKNNVTFKEEDGKYYVNGANGFVKINVLPFGMPTGVYPYTFTKLTPSGSFQSNTNSVSLTLKTPPSFTYDGTLSFPDSPLPGSEMVVSEQLIEEGEYVYTFRINNQFKEVRVVVLSAPQLRVNALVLNETLVPSFDGIYYLNHSTSTRFLEINLIPENVEATYKYIINNTGEFPVGSSLTSALKDLVIIDGQMNVGISLPAAVDQDEPFTTTFIIALYRGNVQVGLVTRVVIIAQPVSVTLFFNSNGGTVIAPRTQFVTTAISEPTPPTRTGYTFDGWFNNVALTTPAINFSTYVMPEVDSVIYAKWNLITYTITYDATALGAAATTNPTSYNIETATITLINPTGRSGFIGWFDAASAGNQVTSIPIGSSGNKTIYARFS